MEKLSWEGHGGFETLLKFTTPIFWVFFLLTSLSLFVLRERDPHVERPFLMPLYPLLPLIFTGTCVYMLQSGINYAGNLGLVGAGLLFIGLVLYGLSSWGSPPHVQKTDNPVA
jgi:amino acid transporter